MIGKLRPAAVLLCLWAASTAHAQTKNGDELVTVPKRYVSSEGLAHSSTTAQTEQISSWAGIGREVGEATKEALNSVVDVSDKFGKTDVGHFVLFMVAWHILGDRLLAIAFGIPIFIGGVLVWLYVLRRFFMTRRVLVKEDKATKVKEWQVTGPYKFENTDGKGFAAVSFVLTITAWSIAMLTIIFRS